MGRIVRYSFRLLAIIGDAVCAAFAIYDDYVLYYQLPVVFLEELEVFELRQQMPLL